MAAVVGKLQIKANIKIERYESKNFTSNNPCDC